MAPVIRISKDLYKKLEDRAVGFDTPANVIERLVDDTEGTNQPPSSGEAVQSVPKDTRELIEHALGSHFNVVPRPFGQKQGNSLGASDGNEGVQWNIGFNKETGETVLGVNLEGMKYGGRWPIAKLLLRERDTPTLSDLCSIPEAELIGIYLTRDAWQMAARPPIEENEIEGCGTSLNDLAQPVWAEMVEQGLDCLNPKANYKGRGIKMVTLAKSGKVAEKEISPHLTVRTSLWTVAPTNVDELENYLTAAQERLQPVYDLVKERSQ
ncbi:MAG: hypothetical protein V7746_20445 [Halioglobus sp.]